MNGNEPIVVKISFRKEDFHKLCRFCLLETNEALLDLFTLKYEEIFITDILEELFGHKINSNNELPQNVCQNCLVEIIRCCNFKKTYDASILILQAIISSNIKDNSNELDSDDIKPCLDELCLDEIKLEPDEIVEEINNKNSTEQSMIPTIEQHKHVAIKKTVDAVSTGNSTTIDHQSYTKPLKRKSYTRRKLPKPCKNDPTIEEIMSRDNYYDSDSSTDRAPVVEDPRLIEAKQYRCACGEIFQLESEFNQHRKVNKHKTSRKRYFCKLCKRNTFYNRPGYLEHLRSHAKEKPFVCEICAEGFINIFNLRRHTRIKHNGEKPHVCEICGKRLTTLFNLNIHKRSHTGEKPFLCDICGKGFESKIKLDAHRCRHTNVKHNRGSNYKLSGPLVECKQCFKLFSSSTALKAHMLRHGEKTIVCSYCNKAFYTTTALRNHSVIHTGVKAYSCDVCFRKFAHSSSLETHKRVHTGLKPYSCKLCSKAFRQQHHLQTHVRRMHTGERPYVCKFCNKGFPDSAALTIHVRIHTGERPYKCDVCSKAFHHSSSMKKHRLIHFKNNRK